MGTRSTGAGAGARQAHPTLRPRVSMSGGRARGKRSCAQRCDRAALSCTRGSVSTNVEDKTRPSQTGTKRSAKTQSVVKVFQFVIKQPVFRHLQVANEMTGKARGQPAAWPGTAPHPCQTPRMACGKLQVQGRNRHPRRHVQASRDLGTSHEVKQPKQEIIQECVITASCL